MVKVGKVVPAVQQGVKSSYEREGM